MYRLVIVAVLSVLVFSFVMTFRDVKKFQESMVALEKECLASGETKYTCEALITAKRAERNSRNAGVGAGLGAGLAMGIAAGRMR